MKVQELGHIVLYVHDLERSRRFYGDLLGFEEIGRFGDVGAVFVSGSHRTHHELLLLEVGPDATPVTRGRHAGLYHFGLKIGTTDDELKAAVAELNAAGATIVGTGDHTVTHSLYLEDPDGNEIELYIDVQPEVWRDQPMAVIAPTKALRLS
jgi:catechol 2,3-dioxygenase